MSAAERVWGAREGPMGSEVGEASPGKSQYTAGAVQKISGGRINHPGSPIQGVS